MECIRRCGYSDKSSKNVEVNSWKVPNNEGKVPSEAVSDVTSQCNKWLTRRFFREFAVHGSYF